MTKKIPTNLIVALFVAVMFGGVAMDSSAQRDSIEVLCDVTCAPPPPRGTCTTWVSYVCSFCSRVVLCDLGLCLEPNVGGTKITHQICDGVHTDAWSVAPCGLCY